MIKEILTHILKGKTIYRSLSNMSLKNTYLSGNGIDLGAKSSMSSYYKFLNFNENTRITFTDWFSEEPEILKLNLEEKFQIDSNTQDFVILMNVLEHLYNFENCISESFRILKKECPLIGVVPFIHKIHPDPDDYYRYSKSTLQRKFSEAGYSKIHIEALSIGPTTTALSIVFPLIPTKFFKAFLTLIMYFLDKLLIKLFSNHPAIRKDNFPLGYYFHCTK